jgi:hypothetical protein
VFLQDNITDSHTTVTTFILHFYNHTNMWIQNTAFFGATYCSYF